MDGLEHKDERLHATGGSEWRDKLARLRDELGGDDDPAGEPGEEPGETRDGAGAGRGQ